MLQPTSPSQRPAVLVIGGHHRQALVVVRSLARVGYRVILGRTVRRSYAESSRAVDDVVEIGPLDPSAANQLSGAVRKIQSQYDLRAVFPVAYEDMLFLMRHREALPADVNVAMPTPAAIELFIDKGRTLQLVRELGIPHPRAVVAPALSQLIATAEDVGYPCVVKALTDGHDAFGRKALIVGGENELRAAMNNAEEDCGGPYLVQQYSRGPRHNVYFFAKEGDLVSVVEVKILRTDRADGTGLAVEGVSVPLDSQRVEACRRLIAQTNYSGFGAVQFLVNEEAGEAKFLELNARLGANSSFVVALGLDLPRMQMQIAECLPITPGPEVYPIGRRYAWLWGDVRGLRQARIQGHVNWREVAAWLGRMAVANLRCRTHVTWSYRDPKPTAMLFCGKLLEAARVRSYASAEQQGSVAPDLS